MQIHDRLLPSSAAQPVAGAAITRGHVVLDETHRIVSCDEEFAAIFGYRPGALVGRHVSFFFPEVTWPSQRERGQSAGSAADARACMRFSRVVLQGRHALGSVIPVIASLLEAADGTSLLTIRSAGL